MSLLRSMHRPSGHHRLAAALTAATIATAGLATAASPSTAGPASGVTTEDGQTVSVVVKRDRTIVMPETIQPGVTSFRVTTRRGASFQVVQADEDYTKREFVRDLNSLNGKGFIKALRHLERALTFHGGLTVRPGKTGTFATELEEGSYWALDVDARFYRPSRIDTFEVAGDSVGGELSGQVIRAVDEVQWGKTTPRISTKGTIWFQNRSTENHFLEIVKLRKGKTLKDVRRWVNQAKQGNETPPPISFEVGVGTGVVSPGESMSFDYRLPAGQYVMFCFWPDADKGGMPHFLMGMYRALRVD